MIRIAIVDDEEIFLNSINFKIKELMQKNEKETEIYIFTDGKSMLEQNEKTAFDIIFLDIDMPEITGIDISRQIRDKHSDIEIIFVSSKEEMVYESIKYTPFRFIRKNRFENEIQEAIETYLKKRKRNAFSYIFSTENGKKPVAIIDIMYIEVKSHKLYVYFEDSKSNFTANGNMKDIENILSQYGFIRIHQGFLVNYRFINLIRQKEVYLDNGTRLPLSRGKYEKTKLELMRMSREG